MDMRDSRNLTIGILLSLGSVLLTCTLYLAYHFLMAEEINRDLNMEYAEPICFHWFWVSA